MRSSHDKPQPYAIGKAWREFERTMLPATPTLLPEDREAARTAFYFGALAMLQLIVAVSERAPGSNSVAVSLEILREEIEAYITAEGEQLN